MLENGCHKCHRCHRFLERQCLFHPFYYRSFPVLRNFFETVSADFISSQLIGSDTLESYLIQQHPHLRRAQRCFQFQIYHTQYIRYAIHLIRFSRLRNTEMLAYLVFLHIGSLETAHVLGQCADFLLVEPIRKAALPKVHHLAVQACIIQRVVVRTEDVFHFER